jgi:hypothetical protein
VVRVPHRGRRAPGAPVRTFSSSSPHFHGRVGLHVIFSNLYHFSTASIFTKKPYEVRRPKLSQLLYDNQKRHDSS